MRTLGLPVICMKPSLVQNIGYRGLYQRDESMRAHDFVGRRAAWLVLRDILYAARRWIIDTGERIPEGKLKELLKLLAKPVRNMLSV
jgi:hypothetical protein